MTLSCSHCLSSDIGVCTGLGPLESLGPFFVDFPVTPRPFPGFPFSLGSQPPSRYPLLDHGPTRYDLFFFSWPSPVFAATGRWVFGDPRPSPRGAPISRSSDQRLSCTFPYPAHFDLLFLTLCLSGRTFDSHVFFFFFHAGRPFFSLRQLNFRRWSFLGCACSDRAKLSGVCPLTCWGLRDPYLPGLVARSCSLPSVITLLTS